jgi:hypothetical protein
LSTTNQQQTGRNVLTAVETTSHTDTSKSLMSTDEPKCNNQKFKSHTKQRMQLKARLKTPKWLFGFSRGMDIYESRANAG